jgi:hypothetical protein
MKTITEIDLDSIYFGDNNEYFDENEALAWLLLNEYAFVNFPWWLKEKDGIKNDELSVQVFINTNDVFAWGCADAESIEIHHIKEVFEELQKDPKWGVINWVCKKSNLKPQAPIVVDMKKDGVWTDEMEALRDNK